MKSSLPLVSIIIPVYKVENYLRRCVDSVLNQTYGNLEIILVDDGSPDNCPVICNEYFRIDHRIKVIHKTNGGLSDARNIGMKASTGEYVTFVDSDDYISRDLISMMMNETLAKKADVICCGVNIVDTEGLIYDYCKCDISFATTGEALTKRLIRDEYPFNFAWGKLYKKDLLNSIEFPVGRLYEDIATVYRITANASKAYCMRECLYYYERGREGNITSELNSGKAAKSYYHGCLNCIERLKFCESHKDYSDMIPVIINQLCSWMKLCAESAIKLGKTQYGEYISLLSNVSHNIRYPLAKRIKIILNFSSLYYYLYPIIGRNS